MHLKGWPNAHIYNRLDSMKKIVTAILLAFTVPCITLAQTPAPASSRSTGGTPAAQPAAGNSQNPKQNPNAKQEGPTIIKPPAGLTTGIRFVFGMPNSNLNKALMPINKDVFVEVPMRFGLPAARVPFPEDRVIRFYEDIPTKENKLQPFFKAEIPANISGKILGVFCFSGKQMLLSYIEEKDCQPGMTIIKNMTSTPYLLIVPQAPSGEKDRMLMAGNQEWKFGQSLPKANRTLPMEIRKELTLKNGQKQWFIERKMILKTDKICGNLILILPNPAGNSILMQSITIYKD